MVMLITVGWGVTAPAATAADISRGFAASGKLEPGALVSFDQGSNSLHPADLDNADYLVGVVASPGESLVELADSAQNVQVTSSGVHYVLVSNLNGPIEPGSKVAPSPLQGAGMRAVSRGKVVGVAQAALTDQTPGVKQEKITDKSQREQTVLIGRVPVLVEVGYYAGDPIEGTSYVQELVSGLVGRSVSGLRILIASMLLVAALVSVSVMLSTGVKSGIVSIGRNPLSEPVVNRSLLHIMRVAMIILTISSVSIYLILRV
jgi:hypothetical protein